MSDFISQLPPPAAADPPADAARFEHARKLIEQHRCNFCHNRNFSGERNVPRLAGQREDYLIKALREYKSETRRGYEPWMSNVLYAIKDEEIADLAYFLSRVR